MVTINGYQCSICGKFVVSGTTHFHDDERKQKSIPEIKMEALINVVRLLNRQMSEMGDTILDQGEVIDQLKERLNKLEKKLKKMK